VARTRYQKQDSADYSSLIKYSKYLFLSLHAATTDILPKHATSTTRPVVTRAQGSHRARDRQTLRASEPLRCWETTIFRILLQIAVIRWARVCNPCWFSRGSAILKLFFVPSGAFSALKDTKQLQRDTIEAIKMWFK
jgi:hypothetical protein